MGNKTFYACCSETGYCSKFELYKSKCNNQSMLDVGKNTGSAALLRSVANLAHTGRIIYCDRYYTSISLFIQLLTVVLYACGTIQPNRKCFHVNFRMNKAEKVERGAMKQAACKVEAYGTLVAIFWIDRKPVHVLSSGIPT